MAVRIRLKKMGRRHRPFFRVCAMDQRAPRDGRVIEELGTYDPMVPETDARVTLDSERIDYWMSVGAKPTHKVGVLIRKYGTNGTHLDEREKALERLKALRADKTSPPPPPEKPKPAPEPAAEAPADEAPAEEAAVAEETPAEEPASEAAPEESAEAKSEE